MADWRIGDVTITKVVEEDFPVPGEFVLPDAQAEKKLAEIPGATARNKNSTCAVFVLYSGTLRSKLAGSWRIFRKRSSVDECQLKNCALMDFWPGL